MSDPHKPLKERSSSRSITARQRRLRAFQLRLQGLTYQQIGDDLGVSKVRAFEIVKSELAELNKKLAEEVEAVRRMELERLDAMFEPMYRAAKNGDQFAVDRALNIMNRRAKFLGLDSPQKVETDLKVFEVNLPEDFPDFDPENPHGEPSLADE